MEICRAFFLWESFFGFTFSATLEYAQYFFSVQDGLLIAGLMIMFVPSKTRNHERISQ